MVSSSVGLILKYVAGVLFLVILASIALFGSEKVSGRFHKLIHSGILSSPTSAVLRVVQNPKVTAGNPEPEGMLELFTRSFIKYKLTISPQSCLSFNKDKPVYEIENTTYQKVTIPVFFKPNGGCKDLKYIVSLYILNDKTGEYVKVEDVTVYVYVDVADVVKMFPKSGSLDVLYSDLSEFAGSDTLTNYAEDDNLKKLETFGIVIVNTFKQPLNITITSSDTGEVLIASNLHQSVMKITSGESYTLYPNEVILVRPENINYAVPSSKTIFLPYASTITVGFDYMGTPYTVGSVNVQVMPRNGLLGVVLQNYSIFVPIARSSDTANIGVAGINLLSFKVNTRYIYDAFTGGGIFRETPDTLSLMRSTSFAPASTPSLWTIVSSKTDVANKEVVRVYGYRPDIEDYGTSRAYVWERVKFDSSSVYSKGGGEYYYKYDVDVNLFFNENKNLVVFGSPIQGAGNDNAFESLQSEINPIIRLARALSGDDDVKKRLMMVATPTFEVAVKPSGGYIDNASSIKVESVSIDNVKYSYELLRLTGQSGNDEDGYFHFNIPETGYKHAVINWSKLREIRENSWAVTMTQEDAKSMSPGTMSKLIEEAKQKGLIRSDYVFNLDNPFPDAPNNDANWILKQTDEKCSVVDRLKDLNFGNAHLNCYVDSNSVKNAKVYVTGDKRTAYVLIPLTIGLAYHSDFPDMTTGMGGVGCRGASPVFLEAEDMISLLAPWTDGVWCNRKCLVGNHGCYVPYWAGKHSDQLLILRWEGDITFEIKEKGIFNDFYDKYKVHFRITYFVPLLTPAWDSYYLYLTDITANSKG